MCSSVDVRGSSARSCKRRELRPLMMATSMPARCSIFRPWPSRLEKALISSPWGLK
jgi:hypothetical protein